MSLKKLTKKELEKRKIDKYELIAAYTTTAGEQEINIENITYDKFKIYQYKDGIKEEVKYTKEDKKIKFTAEKKGEYILYGKDKNRLLGLIITAAFLALMAVGQAAYSNIPAVKDTVDKIYNTVTGKDTPTTFKIKSENDDWVKKNLVAVETPSTSSDGIKYYQYCIIDSKDTSKCKWKKTTTQNVVVSENGIHYVVFRAVSKENKKGKESNIIQVKIDNESPAIENIKIEDSKLKINASDKYSGINKHYYKLENGEYIESKKEIDLSVLAGHRVTIRVEDKVGNFSEVVMNVDQDDIDTKDVTEENNTNESESENENGNNSSDEKDEENTKEYEMPEINLNKVPSSIIYKDEYEIPSYYKFSDMGGEVECVVGDTKITNTNELNVGTNLIQCVAKDNNGLEAKTEKEVEVSLKKAKNAEYDGWITMNLYFPEGSTDWEWRIGNDDIRTGFNDDAWQPYTGPIKVKLSDVDNVYIRYKQNGETKVIAPTGKLLVDIQPTSYSLLDGQKTKVTIQYEKNAQTKEYRINGGAWQEYTKAFEVGPNTLIEARVIKTEKIYDEYGEYQFDKTRQNTDSVAISEARIVDNKIRPIASKITLANGSQININPVSTPMGPTVNVVGTSDYVLAGPAISQDTLDLVDETYVTVTPQYDASDIYISVGYGGWQKYTAPVKVTKNSTVRAYYIRKSDGLRSQTSHYSVDNIDPHDVPYVRIDVSPSTYIKENVEIANVSIYAKDYDALEYSLDGKVYVPYTGPFQVKETTYVYAKAINSNGENIVRKLINTYIPPKEKEELNITINADPDKSTTSGLVNKTKISINYDPKAEKRYYRIGYFGELKEYTGPFEITENTTIYATATSANGSGAAEKSIDFLTTGISAPIIKVLDDDALNQKEIEITYSKNSINSTYQIDNGDITIYNGIIKVTEDCTITATNEDALGNTSSSKLYVHVSKGPQYTLIDEGDYYLLHLNYPSSSAKESREYKWQDDGSWTQYEDHGILLIKASAVSMISKDGVEIEDENGDTVVYTKDYYVVTEITDALFEHLYMRWDTKKPDTPTFEVNTAEPTKEVKMAIKYDLSCDEKYYKIVDSNGDSGWKQYTGSITIKENDAVVYAYSKNISEVKSSVASYRVSNIDDEAPEVDAIWDDSTPKQKVAVKIVGKDNLGIDKVGYIKGEYTSDSNLTDATYINNNSVFMAEAAGKYTIIAVDKVGNIATDVIEIQNVDTTPPKVAIEVLTKEYGSTLEFKITSDDAVLKEYKVGTNNEWQPYDNKVKINAADYIAFANDDGTITIYAKVEDSAGNSEEGNEIIYNLDLDAPMTPEIKQILDYGTLYISKALPKQYVEILYDSTRDDITNYISTNNGTTWSLYEGPVKTLEKNICAKSVKNESGLTISTCKEMTDKEDIISEKAYDKNNDTSDTIKNTEKFIYVDDTLANQQVFIKGKTTGTNELRFYNESKTLIGKETLAKDETIDDGYDVPVGAKYMSLYSSSTSNVIEAVEIYGKKVATLKGDSILSILKDNTIKNGYYNFEVNNTIYKVHAYNYNGNQTWDEDMTFGDANDVGTSSSYAKNMVVVKVNGDLTVNGKVEPYYTNYGGPKGFTLYVTGKLTNNGTIDNSHGAYAEGQEVYLWKNADGTYEEVPAEGASNNVNGEGRQTGGGTTGKSIRNYGKVYAGTAGTSYSGGSGGGSGGYDTAGTNAALNGGAGGYGGVLNDNGGLYQCGGGAGNPGGNAKNAAYAGKPGTGGLLIIYADTYDNKSLVTANGAAGGTGTGGYGGSSGGGSINIFTNQSTNINSLGIEVETKYNQMLGEFSNSGGKGSIAGKSGTINIGEIRNGQYCDLKDCIQQDIDDYKARRTITGDSILSILKDNDIKSGYYIFKANNEEYPVHLYTYDGNQTWDEDKTFGDDNDISTDVAATSTSAAYRSYAKNMVVVKVNGDLTVNGKVEPYYTNYGGPKGFTLYVTGKLTNNGTIDNSHGAYAEGQEVYLWKNADGTYEEVPAEGASNNVNGEGRQTGGGTTGKSIRNYGKVYAGTAGTSYSGGSGGGSGGYDTAGTNAALNGGAGGYGGVLNDNGGLYQCGGGAGNPGGNAKNAAYAGKPGTGGLLIIYADTYDNKSLVTANGAAGGTGTGGYGGSSGGGSINIFYNYLINEGNATANSVSSPIVGKSGTITYKGLIPLKITFNANGGTVTPKVIKVSPREEIGTLPIPVSYDENINFLGWYTDKTYTTRVLEDYIVNNNMTLYAKWGIEETYEYSGTEKIFDVKKSGTYIIETWGAEGGYSSYGKRGGYGAYSVGTVTLNSGDKLYINVGGKGTYCSNASCAGGYNGGGRGGAVSNFYAGSGGGATSVAYKSGLLKELDKGTLSDDGTYYVSNDILIVAGGGGGTSNYPKTGTSELGTGGNAGGYKGVNGKKGLNNYAQGYGGTQIAGGTSNLHGSFGQGGSNTAGAQCGNGSTGGGGGFFGGSTGYCTSGGAGGSGYIANPNLVNKKMVTYTTDSSYVSTATETKTEITTCVSEEPVENCAKKNNGYVKITYISSNDTSSTPKTLMMSPKSIAKTGKTQTVANPEITINETGWSTSKEINISYVEGYKKEYSIDKGKTWIEYTEPITITDESVIFARSVDNDGNVVASSSYIIEKVDDKEPTVEFLIPDEITQGDEYTTFANIKYTKSGGVGVCVIDENEQTTADLEVGIHKVKCSVTTGANKVVEQEKEFTVKEKEPIMENVTTEETEENTEEQQEAGGE